MEPDTFHLIEIKIPNCRTKAPFALSKNATLAAKTGKKVETRKGLIRKEEWKGTISGVEGHTGVKYKQMRRRREGRSNVTSKRFVHMSTCVFHTFFSRNEKSPKPCYL